MNTEIHNHLSLFVLFFRKKRLGSDERHTRLDQVWHTLKYEHACILQPQCAPTLPMGRRVMFYLETASNYYDFLEI